MDYVKPVDVASAMVSAGRSKLAVSPIDLIIRGALAGAILAAATSLAFTAMVQTNSLRSRCGSQAWGGRGRGDGRIHLVNRLTHLFDALRKTLNGCVDRLA